MKDIQIALKGRIITAKLDEISPIADTVYRMLPLCSRINTWGDELYFPLNLNRGLNSPTHNVNLGDIAYSRVYDAFCIFYGKTPISTKNKIFPNSPVDIIGRLDQDPEILKDLLSGWVRQKKRRIFNRVGFLKKFAEIIFIDRR
jgi:hypothetical protein